VEVCADAPFAAMLASAALLPFAAFDCPENPPITG
jgi:hypothetical protein